MRCLQKWKCSPAWEHLTLSASSTFIFLLILSFLGIFSFTFTSFFFLLCILKLFLGTFFLFLSFLFLSLFLLLLLLFSFSFRGVFILSFLGFCSLNGLLHLDLLLLDVAGVLRREGASGHQKGNLVHQAVGALFKLSASESRLICTFACLHQPALYVIMVQHLFLVACLQVAPSPFQALMPANCPLASPRQGPARPVTVASSPDPARAFASQARMGNRGWVADYCGYSGSFFIPGTRSEPLPHLTGPLDFVQSGKKVFDLKKKWIIKDVGAYHFLSEMEAAIWNCDQFFSKENDIENILNWNVM
ncbi:hypothetical protein QTO34_006286 [Cnephaeus nilssonii]|uniref:Uncharacterized protein n=1 Tax=Cnephaeus nilssonii TaxID=3371016 RepID=A0AA40HN94_CNENI|nr:hypothetical protein QTO34_006286 [Eptesicus nilssonii]